eukprot:CAMPEP_0201897664 /NCGR_PEP_ID=MMETSP0902-20130614/47020_1 /ASSEMBLY_ACC=CAM_ASM_000551 /TAXON_ID=420261 /ORGANISM="Thalassiosira antarctica, Strain CCMP982" /LENGTH=38 /DNA_ID= /DNA_START= /DNA_END= /DNA_ORIENTATION=
MAEPGCNIQQKSFVAGGCSTSWDYPSQRLIYLEEGDNT